MTKGGVLFIGSTEQIMNYKELGFVRDKSFFFEKNNRIIKAKNHHKRFFVFSVLQSKANVLRQENGGKHDWYTGAEENQNPETPGQFKISELVLA